MMSLKPRNVDFDETWSKLKETVADVVSLAAVERGVWSARFSDVYALCVAHPDPLADRLYAETRSFLESHVGALLQQVRGAELEVSDPDDLLLTRYVSAWQRYSTGVSYLNSLYSYLNLQHIKRQKISDAEIIYGSAATVSGAEQDSRQLEVGELGLMIWERVLVRPLAAALTTRIVAALTKARDEPPEPRRADALRAAIHSMRDMSQYRSRSPLALYEKVVLQPYLASASAQHAEAAAARLTKGVSLYMQETLEGLDREMALCARYLHSSSSEAVRACYEQSAVAAHLPALHAEAERLLRGAGGPGADAEQRRVDLHRLYLLVRGLELQPLVAAARDHAAREGAAALRAAPPGDEAHVHFVNAMLALHSKYSALFADVFGGAQAFQAALDKACSEVVNAPPPPDTPRAPELLARYCDSLLRKRGGGGGGGGGSGGGEAEAEARLSAAILVFKYIDDKDVFQKHYARALARRLIHQLSASMEQEEAMINRLKAACGYEFTNKLHRMFTDVAVSADLNAKFQLFLAEQPPAAQLPNGFFVQVLQAGAWPLGGAMAPLAPPARLERGARLFEQFYRAAFSGRRLAWLHALCTGELRYRHDRLYHLHAATPQCGILLAFESADEVSARALRDSLQLEGEQWARQLKPLLEHGLLTADAQVLQEDSDGVIKLNLSFSSRRTKIRISAAAPPPPQQDKARGGAGGGAGGAGGAGGEGASCDDDRKMYLQAAIVRIMKQRKVLRHTELIAEVVGAARGSFAPSVALIKKCVEALIDKQYLERTPHALDTYSYLA